MKRREFIGLLGAATALPLAAYAQQEGRVRRIGVLLGFAESDRDAQSGLALFREELRKLGWAEGRNIEMEIHAAGGDVESIKRFAKELVAVQPDLSYRGDASANAYHPGDFRRGWRSHR
jgi:putative tryptophan/tyrosine transport system substrate-binding protein